VSEPRIWWSWAALIIVALARGLAAVTIGRAVLDDAHVLRDLWLVPVRDFVALAVWFASFAGNEIEWRGMKFRVRNGKLEKP
jgi:ceramide glucosyltransferase